MPFKKILYNSNKYSYRPTYVDFSNIKSQCKKSRIKCPKGVSVTRLNSETCHQVIVITNKEQAQDPPLHLYLIINAFFAIMSKQGYRVLTFYAYFVQGNINQYIQTHVSENHETYVYQVQYHTLTYTGKSFINNDLTKIYRKYDSFQ